MYNSINNKIISSYINPAAYLELSFLTVLAFPNASKSGFDWDTEK